jgi:hypothetical protein
MTPDHKTMAAAFNLAQERLDHLPSRIPECVRPALMSAMTNWFLQEKLPPALFIETGGIFPEQLLIPPSIDGPDLPRWMYSQLVERGAAAVYFSYESNEDTLIVVYHELNVFHKLSAEIATNGKKRDLGAWTIETLYPAE